MMELNKTLCLRYASTYTQQFHQKTFVKKSIFSVKKAYYHQKTPKFEKTWRHTLDFFDETLLMKVFLWTYTFTLFKRRNDTDRAQVDQVSSFLRADFLSKFAFDKATVLQLVCEGENWETNYWKFRWLNNTVIRRNKTPSLATDFVWKRVLFRHFSYSGIFPRISSRSG